MYWIFVIATSAFVLLGAYIAIQMSEKKRKAQKETQRLKDVLYKIAMNAQEAEIREMATKILSDETYDSNVEPIK